MNVGPQLTKEEFRDIDNGKCHLYAAIAQLEGVIHPDLLKRLNSAMGEIENGLARAYKLDEAAYDERHNAIREIKEQLGDKIKVSIWSIFEVEDMNTVPYPAAQFLQYKGQKVALKPNSTWIDLWVAADEAIRLSQDLHHVFIESIGPVDERVPHEIVQVVELSCGS